MIDSHVALEDTTSIPHCIHCELPGMLFESVGTSIVVHSLASLVGFILDVGEVTGDASDEDSGKVSAAL